MIFTVLASLGCLLRTVSLSLSHSVSYTDPVVSTRNIRGTIYDRRGNALAFDTSTRGFLVSSKNGIQETASFISSYADITAVQIAANVDNGTYFIPLSVTVTDSNAEIQKKITDAGLEDRISVTTGYYRSYPYTFLDFLLGSSVNSHSAEGGIEEHFNSYLSASPTLGERTERGEDLVLTIDLELEKILVDVLEDEDETLSAVILNSRGEILAFRGKADDSLFSAVTYSHSDEYETMLFDREQYISTGECTSISSYYVYLSTDSDGALSRIVQELERNGRI